jgi:hypothetical protein
MAMTFTIAADSIVWFRNPVHPTKTDHGGARDTAVIDSSEYQQMATILA